MDAFVVVDLGFGDFGKGTSVDFIVREYGANCVVRFNGGAQAAHNVELPNGIHHTFSQFGSGTLSDVITYLSKFIFADPVFLANEAEHLEMYCGIKDPLRLILLDEKAHIVTPFHWALNRLKEWYRGEGRHGSCGFGFGEAVSDSFLHPDICIRANDLRDMSLVKEKLELIRQQKLSDAYHIIKHIEIHGKKEDSDAWENRSLLMDAGEVDHILRYYKDVVSKISIVSESEAYSFLKQQDVVVFEGAQGVLLDEDYGFHPHTTWSKTTCENADAIIDILKPSTVTRYGGIRAYTTRHGRGPFPTECGELTTLYKDVHNVFNPWQEDMRFGWFDVPLFRYSLAVAGNIDGLIITCLDHVREHKIWGIVREYEGGMTPVSHSLNDCKGIAEVHKPSQEAVITMIEEQLRRPCLITSEGPTYAEKRFTSKILQKAA